MKTLYAEFLDNFERLLCEVPVEVATLPDLFRFIKKRKQELESTSVQRTDTHNRPLPLSPDLRWYVSARPLNVPIEQVAARWMVATKMSMFESMQNVQRLAQTSCGAMIQVSRMHALELHVAGFDVVDSSGVSIALEVVSLPWILNQLAGRGFSEAYDFIKKGAVR